MPDAIEDRELDLTTLQEAVSGNTAAFQAITEYQPAGGPGDKVFPPTYAGGKYAMEERLVSGEVVQAVLLDSVQSQANRMELALLDAWESGELTLPVVSVDFGDLAGKVTSLEAPHRVADAILRDSVLDGKPFRKTEYGRTLDSASPRNAADLFGFAPTSLLFGLWDSTGPKGGMGAKFQRAIVSEMIGLQAVPGKKTSSRIDPLQIPLAAGPLYEADNEVGWTLGEEDARQQKGRPVKLGGDGKPSEANHGNVTPDISDGGVTMSKAVQTTVLSLIALRRLRFPVNGQRRPEIEIAARTVLAALGLFAATRIREEGADLRSRCCLFATAAPSWTLLGAPGSEPIRLAASSEGLAGIFEEAVSNAKSLGLPWQTDEVILAPSEQLEALVRRSQELASAGG